MEKKKKWPLLAAPLFLLAFVLGGTDSGQAQDKKYPSREINITIGFQPGGTLDIAGRIMAKVMSKTLGQQVVIVNKPGGTQSVAYLYVVNARPDGYSLIYLSPPQLILKRFEEPSLPAPSDQLTWLGSSYKFDYMLVVRADAPWKTFEDFADFAKKNPDKVIFGSDGAGGTQHLAHIQLAEMLGVKGFTYVPFAGGGPAVQALLGGHINAATISPGPTGAYVKSGDLKYLVNFAPQRNSEYPQIPAVKEKGLQLFAGSWSAFAAPKNLPPPIAQKLTLAIQEATRADEVKTTFKKMGGEPNFHPPQEIARMWKEQENLYGSQLKKLGMIK